MYLSPTGVPVFVLYCSYYSFPVRSLTLGLYSWVSIPGCLSLGVYPRVSIPGSLALVLSHFSLSHTHRILSLPFTLTSARPPSLSHSQLRHPLSFILQNYQYQRPLNSPSRPPRHSSLWPSRDPSFMSLNLSLPAFFISISCHLPISISLAHSLSHPLTLSLIRSPTHNLFPSLTHSPLTNSQTLPLTNSSTHSLTYPSTNSLTHSPTRPFTHSPTSLFSVNLHNLILDLPPQLRL